MKRTTYRTILVTCAAAGALAGCGADEPQSQAAAAEIDAPEILGRTDTVYAAVERRTLPSSRIYYTLTDHEWYARGEPLLHENAAYHPAGMPVSATLDDMEHVGDYQGVEYYVRSGDERVYVPVFEGYWQPFRRDTTVRAGD
jgi:hypothetical protein